MVALTEVRTEDKSELAKLVTAIKTGYVEEHEQSRKQWGGGIMGAKALKKVEKHQKSMGSTVKV